MDRNIYGHFVEHLGRGVYEGIWVGPDSPIPNVRPAMTPIRRLPSWSMSGGHGSLAKRSLSVSASRDRQGRLHLSVVNPDPTRPVAIEANIAGPHGTKASAQTLTAPRIDERVQFDKPDPFVPSPLAGVRIKGDLLTVQVPAKSVTTIEIVAKKGE